jgi:hypothetical protein
MTVVWKVQSRGVLLVQYEVFQLVKDSVALMEYKKVFLTVEQSEI